MLTSELKTIAERIISSDGLSEQVISVKSLSGFYDKITEDKNLFVLSGDNEKIIKGGHALSTYNAAVCTDDYLRTAYFLKGIHKAVVDLHLQFPHRKINILYAGCGPFATLLLPLLPLFNKERIDAIVLDINTSSIQSVKNLLAILELESYRLSLVEADATNYQKPEEWGIDLFISETMHYALTAEPQVSITKNFIPQLLPHSIFIPKNIHIDLVYTFFAKEPFLRQNENPTDTKLKPNFKRHFVDRLFSISRDCSELLSGTQITSGFYAVPAELDAFPDLCIFTSVEIYDGIVLEAADSLITNPYCITSLFHLKAYSEFQLVYDFIETPNWTYIVK
ncbi:MAG TPA: hypothetical protein VF676_07065 [Flavobacterium sp.]